MVRDVPVAVVIKRVKCYVQIPITFLVKFFKKSKAFTAKDAKDAKGNQEQANNQMRNTEINDRWSSDCLVFRL